MNIDTATIRFRGPTESDAGRIWQLVRDSGALEENSPYCYLLLCTHFSGHSVIAERDGKLAGFVTAYRPPSEPDALFVWQIGVAPAGRGHGLGTELLGRLVERPENCDARYLIATVAPANEPSRRLFAGFARDSHAPCKRERGYPADLFPTAHPCEPLIRIGPLVPRERNRRPRIRRCAT